MASDNRQVGGRDAIAVADRVVAASAAADVAIDLAARDLIELSHSIHAEPELGFEEVKSAAKVTELLAQRGFEVQAGVADLPTAFTATFGSGDLVIGICAEYDALPEIGHACGHNIIAASTVGAALALADVAQQCGLTVKVFGTPAEEDGGGKVLMLERGAFDGVAAAMMVHAGPVDIAGATSLALADLAVTFAGREAHASFAPQFGRNAADAVTVAQVGIGLLRQHLVPGQQVHGIVTDGGTAPNVVPDRAEMRFNLRAATNDSLADLQGRIADCFAAGALATGCTHEVRTATPTYTALTPDPRLVQAYREVVIELGRTPLAPELEGSQPLGSTDMGNVTNVIPGIHPIIGIDSEGSVPHQRAFAAACAKPSSDRAVIDGATALARTAIRVSCDPGERDRLLAGVVRRTAVGAGGR
ncbi:M20 family metallopeptidase [Aldersonia sp. NBC_00410]|uniref:M20 family metallopeptidase n=1 Tax=Aldersonia sp. NBC_00410 TaxID=2975954 RepID=UPI00225AC8B9|nr:M20 family metallopeptidase [Aldersonia sp. NBC_00410]MCX5044481.1 M20 family metallopeptidase [Aldersonia sp. NBC_00410]